MSRQTAPACSNCEAPASQRGRSLPLNQFGLTIVGPHSTAEWGAVPSCDLCADVYSAIPDAVSDKGYDDILTAVAQATRAQREVHAAYLRLLTEIRDRLGRAIDGPETL